jgi:hypothetical protein
MLYYPAIALTILSSMLYHVLLKLTPKGAHPALSLLITYATAAAICGGALFFLPLKTSLGEALRQLNWASYGLALGLVGLEFGFLLAYRARTDLEDAHRFVDWVEQHLREGGWL